MPAIVESGENGHYLFSERVEVWAPLVEDFLRRQDLPRQDLDPGRDGKLVELPDNYPRDPKEIC